jgi:hypothetical protein
MTILVTTLLLALSLCAFTLISLDAAVCTYSAAPALGICS